MEVINLPQGYHPKTVDELERMIVESGYFLAERIETSDTPIIAQWGSGTYKVSSDGTMELFSSDYDSSD